MKRVIKAAIDPDQALAFLESIDLEPLYQEIQNVLGLSGLEFTHTINTRKAYDPYIQFKSENIVDSCGMFAKMMEEANITEFNCKIKTKEDGFSYWTSVAAYYEFTDGGFNHHPFMNAWYSDGEWTFRSDI